MPAENQPAEAAGGGSPPPGARRPPRTPAGAWRRPAVPAGGRKGQLSLRLSAEERRRLDDRAQELGLPVSRLLVDSALRGEVSLVTGEQLLQLQQAVELVAASLAGIEHERPQRWAAILEGVVPIVERLIVERAP